MSRIGTLHWQASFTIDRGIKTTEDFVPSQTNVALIVDLLLKSWLSRVIFFSLNLRNYHI